ncbi:MAG: DUF4157 domain-containing protein [bacterium]|nr:DUF4157 domain-containing protein [bacterium]
MANEKFTTEKKDAKIQRKRSYKAAKGTSVAGAPSLQSAIGNQEFSKLFKSAIQAKLTVGSPNDVYEQEADRVAEKVVNMTDAQVQSKQNDESIVQAKGSSGGMDVPAGFESGLNSIKGTGSTLNREIREGYESRMNAYFGDVRIHSGNKADKLARSINAEAFTAGHDIVFAARNYKPETREGKKLLGHELTHVLQQKGSQAKSGSIQRRPTTDNFSKSAKKKYAAFVKQVASNGLPVKFLRAVKKEYYVLYGTGDGANLNLEYLELTKETLEDAGEIPGKNDYVRHMAQYSSSIGTLYHESVHAYLEMLSDENRHTGIIKRGIQYYKDAPLINGDKASDPARIFTEAAASYAGLRTAAWWRALSWLKYAIHDADTKQKAMQAIELGRKDYNKSVKDRTVGYQESGGFLGYFTYQNTTTKPISAELKQFVDSHILENKIPDTFDQVAVFKGMIAKIKSSKR